MRLKHPDYIKLVLGTFKKKRASGKLSPLLDKSTPTSIRKECLNVYKERRDRKDDRALRAFFGPADNKGDFLDAILNFETDKFKPLDNYLKGNTEKTDDRNLELLAWLIDVKHRPYIFENNILLSEEELFIINNDSKNSPEIQTTINDAGAKEDFKPPLFPKNESNSNSELGKEKPLVFSKIFLKNESWKNKAKMPILFFLLFLFGGCGIYLLWLKKKEQAGCMYWAYDHFKKVDCGEEDKGREIIPFNKKRFEHFRRITHADTITEKSIGVIYYVSIDAKNEYYSAGGKHPINSNRNLKRLSRYIFDKHLRKANLKDSSTSQ